MTQENNKVLPSGARKPPAAGMGRKKGVQNKITREVKEMILEALDQAGGVAYLAAKAETHPQAFMALVGKVLPLQVTGAGGGPLLVANAAELSDEQLAAIAAGRGS
jgi:hypothetical protein